MIKSLGSRVQYKLPQLTAVRSVVHQRSSRNIHHRAATHAVVEASLQQILAVIRNLEIGLFNLRLTGRDAPIGPTQCTGQLPPRSHTSVRPIALTRAQ